MGDLRGSMMLNSASANRAPGDRQVITREARPAAAHKYRHKPQASPGTGHRPVPSPCTMRDRKVVAPYAGSPSIFCSGRVVCACPVNSCQPVMCALPLPWRAVAIVPRLSSVARAGRRFRAVPGGRRRSGGGGAAHHVVVDGQGAIQDVPDGDLAVDDSRALAHLAAGDVREHHGRRRHAHGWWRCAGAVAGREVTGNAAAWPGGSGLLLFQMSRAMTQVSSACRW